MRGVNDELIWGEKGLMTHGHRYWRTPERPEPKDVMTIDRLLLPGSPSNSKPGRPPDRDTLVGEEKPSPNV
jgi:hypothetical protein